MNKSILITLLTILLVVSIVSLINTKSDQDKCIEDLKYENSQLTYMNNLYLKEIKNLEYINIQYKTARVQITFYSPELGGINSDENPDQTALLEAPISGWTCAISRDLVEKGWLGKTLWIEGLGIRYASDIMADTYKGKKIRNQIDICVGKNDVKKEAHKFGKNTNILVSVIK